MTPKPENTTSQPSSMPLAPWMIRPADGWQHKATRWLPRQAGIPLLVLAAVLMLMLAADFLAFARPGLHPDLLVAQVVLTALAVLAVGILLQRVNRQLLEPLTHLRNWAMHVRGGNLSARIPVPSSGEFADLARDINGLGEELKLLTREMDAQVQAQTERLGRKTRSLEILYDVASSLNRSRSLEELLEGFLDTFIDLVHARAATVRLLTDNKQTRLVACRGLEPSAVEQDLLVDVDQCECGWSARDGQIRIVHGAGRCAQTVGKGLFNEGCQEVVVVPIHYQDRILGIYNLFLDQPISSLGDDLRELLYSISNHLGLAIEKARLDNDARRLAIIEERNMIGNELHDSLAQSLVSMRIHIKMLGEMLFRRDIASAENEVRRLHIALAEAHANLRDLLANFRSRMDQRGLIPAIADMVVNFKEETGIAAFFHNECSELALTPAQEIQIFRIIQEALANIRKHSNALNTRIMLKSDETNNYQLLIEDDGLGIVSAPCSQRGEHVGLSIMRERAERLPGTLTIESEPGEGTRISLSFSGPSQTILRNRQAAGR
ncbi:MAG: histidine kinase [Gammaproteobacteria bacterium]|nr:histidine kinase [Gammaproteobacteria bacterium]